MPNKNEALIKAVFNKPINDLEKLLINELLSELKEDDCIFKLCTKYEALAVETIVDYYKSKDYDVKIQSEYKTRNGSVNVNNKEKTIIINLSIYLSPDQFIEKTFHKDGWFYIHDKDVLESYQEKLELIEEQLGGIENEKDLIFKIFSNEPFVWIQGIFLKFKDYELEMSNSYGYTTSCIVDTQNKKIKCDVSLEGNSFDKVRDVYNAHKYFINLGELV